MNRHSRHGKSRIGLAVLLTLLFTAPTLPVRAGNIERVQLCVDYDLDATDDTAVLYVGEAELALGDWKRGLGRIATSGSSTTTSSFTASSGALGSTVGVNDLLRVVYLQGETSGQEVIRRVITDTSVDQVVVDAAWDLSLSGGYQYTWKDFTTGTATTSGQVPVNHLRSVSLTWQIDQLSLGSGGIEINVECRDAGYLSAWNTLYTATYTAVQTPVTYTIANNTFAYCRLTMELTGTDDGGDLTTNLEKITATLSGIAR